MMSGSRFGTAIPNRPAGDCSHTYYGDVMDQGSPGDFDYAVELPQAIVDMANS